MLNEWTQLGVRYFVPTYESGGSTRVAIDHSLLLCQGGVGATGWGLEA